MNNDAIAKIRMIKASIRCLIFGILGLLPIIGVPFALAALWISGEARVLEKRFWNPARTYRILGVACAAVGTIFWFCILSLVIYNSVFNSGGSGNYGYGGGD